MKLTQKQLFQHIDQLRLGLPKRGFAVPMPTGNDVATLICSVLSIEECDKILSIAKYQLTQYKSHTTKQGKLEGSCDIVIDSSEYASTRPNPPVNKRQSLDDVTSRKQLSRRVSSVFDCLKGYADEEGIDVDRVLGLLLTFSRKKDVSDIGEKLWNNNIGSNNNPTKVPINAALSIYNDCGLGRATYLKLCKTFSSSGHKVLPSWNKLREEQNSITPDVKNLPNPYSGVYFDLQEAVKVTVTRILSDTEIQGSLPNLDKTVTLEMKFGFDGSGSHSIFNQANNVNTNNIIVVMFCPLKLVDSKANELFNQSDPNSPLTQRPVCLQLGKESAESLRSLELFNKDIASLETNGFPLKIKDFEFQVFSRISGYMLDGKAAKLYTGLGGSYCDLCCYSREQCHDPDQVTRGFSITRNIDDIWTIFNDLSDEEGNITRSTADYETRTGLTTKPIATNQVLSTQVLHALLRTFDHWMKTMVHIKARVFDWSESPSSWNKQFLNQAKQEIQDHIFEKIHGVKWDFPDAAGKGGTTTSGNVARDLLHKSSSRSIIISELPDSYQELMSTWGVHLSVIIRILCSSNKVNVQQYKVFCTELYLLILTKFPRVINKHLKGPWISITPSLHKLLGHSWELISNNNEEGLRVLDESGMEGCNKILRKLRINLARKTSQQDNLYDIIRRMWVASDNQVHRERTKTKPFCKNCDVVGHSTRYCPKKNIEDTAMTIDDYLFDMLTNN